MSLKLRGKRKKIIDSVDWKVMPGQNWVVIGPNGAGKTSLLSIISGYRWPSSGAVSVLGRKFGETDLRELKEKVGLVSSYLDTMTRKEEKVVDFVIGGAHGSTRMWRRPRPAERERARRLLKDLGCLEHEESALSEVSQGERQKVAIARALMSRPKLLILDEPCEGLDIQSRESFLDGLVVLLSQKDGPTFIEVTHRTEDVPPGFTHALLLRDGRVLDSGEIATTLTSEKLSRCLGMELVVRAIEGRYYMVAKRGRG